MENDSSSHSFYFLIFIFILYIFSFLKAKKKREKEEEKAEIKKKSPPLSQMQKRSSRPPLPVREVSTTKKAPQINEKVKSPYTVSEIRRGRSKIEKLVEALPSKKAMVAISEILKPYEPIQ